MDVKDRVNIIRLIDKIKDNKESCKRMGINVVSKYREDEKNEKENVYGITEKRTR